MRACVQVTTGAGFSRDLYCLAFSSDREWVYAGSTSGDFVCINVRTVCCVVCAARQSVMRLAWGCL